MRMFRKYTFKFFIIYLKNKILFINYYNNVSNRFTVLIVGCSASWYQQECDQFYWCPAKVDKSSASFAYRSSCNDPRCPEYAESYRSGISKGKKRQTFGHSISSNEWQTMHWVVKNQTIMWCKIWKAVKCASIQQVTSIWFVVIYSNWWPIFEVKRCKDLKIMFSSNSIIECFRLHQNHHVFYPIKKIVFIRLLSWRSAERSK